MQSIERCLTDSFLSTHAKRAMVAVCVKMSSTTSPASSSFCFIPLSFLWQQRYTFPCFLWCSLLVLFLLHCFLVGKVLFISYIPPATTVYKPEKSFCFFGYHSNMAVQHDALHGRQTSSHVTLYQLQVTYTTVFDVRRLHTNFKIVVKIIFLAFVHLIKMKFNYTEILSKSLYELWATNSH